MKDTDTSPYALFPSRWTNICQSIACLDATSSYAYRWACKIPTATLLALADVSLEKVTPNCGRYDLRWTSIFHDPRYRRNNGDGSS